MTTLERIDKGLDETVDRPALKQIISSDVDNSNADAPAMIAASTAATFGWELHADVTFEFDVVNVNLGGGYSMSFTAAKTYTLPISPGYTRTSAAPAAAEHRRARREGQGEGGQALGQPAGRAVTAATAIRGGRRGGGPGSA